MTAVRYLIADLQWRAGRTARALMRWAVLAVLSTRRVQLAVAIDSALWDDTPAGALRLSALMTQDAQLRDRMRQVRQMRGAS
jgi:hypothetical protein